MRFNLDLPVPVMRSATLLLITAFTYGCATEESAVRDDFGNSVRAMIAAQTYEPDKEAPGLDGGKAVNTMEAYRKDVPKPAGEAQAPVQINIGSSSN